MISLGFPIVNSMSLFLKIFLWFWLAMALVVGAFALVSWVMQAEPMRRQWQSIVSDTINVHAQTAAQIYEGEGESGVETFLHRINGSERIVGVAFYQNEQQVAGDAFPERVQALVRKTISSGKIEFDESEPTPFIAERILLKNGASGVLVMQWEHPRFLGVEGLGWRNRLLRILAAILTGGLVCYALARYLTTPIVRLREATRHLADGDLSARVETKRQDEIGQLARDFDEMAERIESLLDSQKRLTRDVSHELRSPLARMNVALELAKQKSGGAYAETAPLLERIETESKRLNDMISQILTLSKLETRSEKIEKREINLKKLVEQTAEDARFEAEGKGKTVKILRADDCRVNGNENLLRSAVENVLRNAVRYTREGTAVEISLENGDGEKSHVKIRDYGSGVPDEELEKIFRPFHRVGEARERKTGGIGLGLAITEQAVEAHDGALSARNAEKGNGLIVEIELPCSKQ